MGQYENLVEALRCCGNEGCHKCPYQKHIHEKFCWVIAMKDAAAAIEALQAEVEELKRVNLEIFEDLPKMGEWIVKGANRIDCSVCGHSICFASVLRKGSLTGYNYCPNCGAKMREVQE